MKLRSTSFNVLQIWLTTETGALDDTLPFEKSRFILHVRKKPSQTMVGVSTMRTSPSLSVTVSTVGDADVIHAANGMNPLFTTEDADGLIKAYRLSTFMLSL